jgi:putative DNA primase/helicase
VGKYSHDLKVRPQWVLWRYEDHKGRWTKVPHQPNGRLASSTDAATWAPFDLVQTAYLTSGSYDGVGFVLTLGDPYAAFDFDHCVDRETGEIANAKVRDYVNRLNSYTEISPSGTGLRLIVRAKLPERDRRTGSFECYEDRRFVSITGHLYQDSADDQNH